MPAATATGATTLPVPASNDDTCRAIAEQINRTRAQWLVLWGTYSRRFWAFHLAISQPGHPDHGRLYITYATGEASLRRCTWQYLGHLDGYGPTDPDADPPLTAQQIIATLTGHTGQPS